jgi:hypothetical protein
VICAAALYELWLLWKMQHGMAEVRDWLDAFNREHFTADEISRYNLEPATRDVPRWLSWLQGCLRPNFCNGLEFTLMLAAVSIIAAAFVLLAI